MIKLFTDSYFNLNKKELSINNELNNLLTNWFSNSIGCLHRVIELFNSRISILIEEAFSSGCCSIEFENFKTQDQDDIKFFVKSFDCSQLIKYSTHKNSSSSSNDISLSFEENSKINLNSKNLTIKATEDKPEMIFSKIGRILIFFFN